MNNKNHEIKIIVDIENTLQGLSVSCGSSTSQKGFDSWVKTFPDNEKSKALHNMRFIKEDWESKGAQVVISYKGLTDEEMKVVEGAQ